MLLSVARASCCQNTDRLQISQALRSHEEEANSFSLLSVDLSSEVEHFQVRRKAGRCEKV
jgi:hypothetical protein